MRETRNYYTTSSNYATINPIPSREEFHRYASNELSEGDFCTNHPSGYQINKVSSALRWTYANDRGRSKKCNN